MLVHLAGRNNALSFGTLYLVVAIVTISVVEVLQEQQNEWNVMVFVTKMEQRAKHMGQCHTNRKCYMFRIILPVHCLFCTSICSPGQGQVQVILPLRSSQCQFEKLFLVSLGDTVKHCTMIEYQKRVPKFVHLPHPLKMKSCYLQVRYADTVWQFTPLSSHPKKWKVAVFTLNLNL